MSSEPESSKSFSRYLRLLGVTARPPSLAALNEIVSAHLTRVPFENVSKLHHRADPSLRLPPLDRYLDGIERHRFGGTCYANNSHLAELLAHLGYDVRLCGADMRSPDVHVVGIVRLEGHDYLVDGGYGGPLLEALPLDRSEPQAIELGGDRCVLEPRDAEGRSRLEMYRDGNLRHGYRVNPAPRRIEEFERVIERSFASTATFMNALVVVRFVPGGSLVLSNLTLIESTGSSRRRETIPGPERLPGTVEARFGIPADITRQAIAGLALTMDAWG